MAGAILSSQRGAPKGLARFARYDVPLLRASEYRGHEVELLLLAWALLLYRYSNGNNVEFTWGRNGTAADFTFNCGTANLNWSLSQTIEQALESLRSYRKQIQADKLVDLDNAIVFFNDECAPSDLPSNAWVSDGDALGGGMTWVSAPVRARGTQHENWNKYLIIYFALLL